METNSKDRTKADTADRRDRDFDWFVLFNDPARCHSTLILEFLVAAIAIVNLGLSLLPGKPTYYQTSSAVLGKIYSNTMMAVFNSRIKFGQSEAFTAADNLVDPPRSDGLSFPRGNTGVVVTHEEYRLPLDAWNYQVTRFKTGM